MSVPPHDEWIDVRTLPPIVVRTKPKKEKKK